MIIVIGYSVTQRRSCVNRKTSRKWYGHNGENTMKKAGRNPHDFLLPWNRSEGGPQLALDIGGHAFFGEASAVAANNLL